MLLPLAAAAAGWVAWLLWLPEDPPVWWVFESGVVLLAAMSAAAARRLGSHWIAFLRRALDIHALLVILLYALAIQFADAHGITTDGVVYFTQLRSVVFDADLDVAREFAFLEQPPRPSHVVPIGPTLVWLPLYLAVAAVDAIGRTLGAWPSPADPIAIGLTLPYVRAALVSSFAIGAAGLLVLHRHLAREFSRGETFAATLLLFGGTSLIWYMVYEPSMTHAASFGFVALFIVYVDRTFGLAHGRRHMIVAGALLGLAFVARTQEAIFALFPLAILLSRRTTAAPITITITITSTSTSTSTSTKHLGTEAPGHPGTRALRHLALGHLWRYAGWGLVGFLPFFLLQLAHSAVLFSREEYALVGAGGYLRPFDSRWADTLWSSWHGFLSWTPLAYVALIGTAAYVRRRAAWALVAVAIVLIMAWINGSTADWGGGWSFGGRRFTSCLVLLAPGLALTMQALRQRPMLAVTATAAAMSVWNIGLVQQYRERLIPADAPVSFAQVVRQQGAVATRPPYFYPFAFPANVLFAWRNDLPIDRYDLLAPEPLREHAEVVFDGRAGKFLLAGWGGRGGDDWGELWWTQASRAEVVLPVAASAAPMEVRIETRARLTDPPTPVAVSIFANGHRIGEFTPDARQKTAATFVTSDSGIWRDGFNRLALEMRRVDGGGERPAAGELPPVGVYRITIRSLTSAPPRSGGPSGPPSRRGLGRG